MGISRRRSASIVSTLLVLAPAVQGLGQAIVQNHCGFDTYLWSVGNSQGDQHTLVSGQSYSETYRTNPNGGGISLKISTDDNVAGNVTQVEYTLTSLLWYDLSRINGSPFYPYGVTLIPSIQSCTPIRCAPSGNCGEGNVFYEPDDTSAIGACDPSADLVFTLCSGTDKAPQNVPLHKGKGNQLPTQSIVPSVAPAQTATSVPTTTFSGTGAPSPFSNPPPGPSNVAPQIPPSPPSPPAPAPDSILSKIPPGETVVTTFITYYTTVDSTTDDVVTVTAKMR